MDRLRLPSVMYQSICEHVDKAITELEFASSKALVASDADMPTFTAIDAQRIQLKRLRDRLAR